MFIIPGSSYYESSVIGLELVMILLFSNYLRSPSLRIEIVLMFVLFLLSKSSSPRSVTVELGLIIIHPPFIVKTSCSSTIDFEMGYGTTRNQITRLPFGLMPSFT